MGILRRSNIQNKEAVKKMRLESGFRIVDTIRYPTGNAAALYE